MNDIFAQKMALRSNALGGIMQALAQMKKKQDEEALMQQDNIMQQSNPLMVDRSYTTGDIARPNTVVSTDLMGKPITPVSIPRVQESQQVNPQFSLANLLVQLQSQNPVTQNRVNQFAKAPAIASAFANKTEQLDPTKDTQTTDAFGNPVSYTKGKPKEQNFSTGFADFFRANADKYSTMQDGLSQAYSDYQNQQINQFGAKEEIKSKYKASKDGKSIGSYDSESGKKMIIWRNPDGSIVEIPSKESVRATQEGQTLQKESNQLTALTDLTKRIEQSAKPEYLGGVVSGLSGNGMGGVLGGAREATGFISDDEVAFRSDVASVKDQLLRARSGAQINESEYQRLLKELPDVNQPKNVFDARLKAFNQRVQDLINAKSKSRGATQKPVTEDPLGIR